MPLNIVDITFLREQSFAVVFENPETKERDLSLFRYRATQTEIEESRIWQPKPDDVTIEFEIEVELLEKIGQWAAERGVDAEKCIRALIYYFVKYETTSL